LQKPEENARFFFVPPRAGVFDEVLVLTPNGDFVADFPEAADHRHTSATEQARS